MQTTAENAPAVEVEGLRQRYAGATVLELAAWRLPPGSRCLVHGASGSGKTTLLHLLAGLTRPSAGRVSVAGEEISAMSPGARDRFRARRIGLVPQRLHLIEAISVADNLRLARRLAGLSPDEAGIAALLDRLGVAALAGRRPAALSEGQAQRAAVAPRPGQPPRPAARRRADRGARRRQCGAGRRPAVRGGGGERRHPGGGDPRPAHRRGIRCPPVARGAGGGSVTQLGLTLAYLRQRPVAALLNLSLLALGVALVAALLLFGAQLQERLGRDARGIELVVGAKGSPLQLVLSAVYQADIPTGNIRLADAQALLSHPQVRQAIPLALGDSVAGLRIVGTEPAYPTHYGAALAAGRMWEAPFEAVLGAAAARRLGLGPGGSFESAHGLVAGGPLHEQQYRVVGVLAPSGTVVDRLVLTSVESVWAAHADHGGAHAEEEREITALLLRFTSPVVALTLPRLINQQTPMMAASPAFESARLFDLVGVGLDLLRGFGALLMVSAGLALLVALGNALERRRRDLALLRCLGASPRWIVGQLLLEALLLSGAGALLGLALGHLAVEILARLQPQAGDLGLTGARLLAAEAWLLLAALGLGVLAVLPAAWRATRSDVAQTLAQG